MIALRIYGTPVPQGRPRAYFNRSLGRVAVFDPETSRTWKETVKLQLLAVRPPTLLRGAVDLALTFYLPRPASLPKSVTEHTKRPDGDNLAKAIKDAMRGVIYADDAQVVKLTVEKKYDPTPGVDIQLTERSPRPP